MSNIGLNLRGTIGRLQSTFLKRGIILTPYFSDISLSKRSLKAIYVDKLNENPPYTHRLVHLAEKISLGLTEEQLELLEIITDFNMEARYPDEKFSFKKRCTRNFSEEYLRKMGDLKKWLTKRI